MKCSKCKAPFNPEDESVICPHFRLDDMPAPVGGFRFPPEARDAIEACLIERDFAGLGKYMEHRNPLVRNYARRMYAALEETPDAVSGA